MAGIYIHIPFCKSRCSYCGFFSTTKLEVRESYTETVCHELKVRSNELRNEAIDTIYFGGGTPSQLSVGQIETILRNIYIIYNVRENAEVTMEGNPDDLTVPYLRALRSIGINRLSMGVQTFDDKRLQLLNRRHSSQQAINAVATAKQAGFTNISIDLMFGFPGQTVAEWDHDIRQALALGVQHLSAYSLMYEDGTPLEQKLSRGEIEELDEDLSLKMYELLLDRTGEAGFQQYEISNFSIPGFHSRHNSSYWHSMAYLGIGAGAHSYDGKCRSFNPDNLEEYLKGNFDRTIEQLTNEEQYNEFVFTALRTREGLSLRQLSANFGTALHDYCLRAAASHIEGGRLAHDSSGETLRLTRKGLFVSNDVMSDLMLV